MYFTKRDASYSISLLGQITIYISLLRITVTVEDYSILIKQNRLDSKIQNLAVH